MSVSQRFELARLITGLADALKELAYVMLLGADHEAKLRNLLAEANRTLSVLDEREAPGARELSQRISDMLSRGFVQAKQAKPARKAKRKPVARKRGK